MIKDPLSRGLSAVMFVFSLTIAFSVAAIGVDAQTSKRTNSKRKASKSAESPSVKRGGEAEEDRKVSVMRNGKRVDMKIDLEKERFDQPAERAKWYLEKRLPKGAKQLPLERYYEAKEKIKRMKRFSTSRGKVVASQAETGDANVDVSSAEVETLTGSGKLASESNAASTGGVLGTWQSLGPGNVGGRTRALIINPSSPSIMYAAGVAGGIWKTTNGGASWSPLDDFMANIAVTTMAFDPGNPNVIYAGTGEGFFNADGVRGAGIFKTTDAGVTWTRLASTNANSNFFFVNDIVVSNVNSQNIYAATRSGVWRSLNGGTSWTQVLVSNAANGANGAMDLVIRTDQATDYVFAAVGTFSRSHIFRNTDAGGSVTWTDVYSEVNQGRTSLAIAPSNQNVIYAMAACIACGAGTNPNFPTANYTDGLLGVFRSTSNGDAGSWTTQVRNDSANIQDTLLLSNPVNGVLTQCGFGTSQFLNQGWYDNQIAVDPSDENKVWAAGVDLFRSDNGGANWGVASYWWFQSNGTPPANGDPQLVHADNHAIVFHPNYNGTTNQTLFIGNDGGVYKTENAKAGNVGYAGGITPGGGPITPSSPICGSEFTPGGFFTVPSPVIWNPLNNGYAVTQFYHGAVYPNGQSFFGGTQDNGTNRGTIANGATWSRINGGDGGYVAVNPLNTNILFLETTGLSIRRSTNGGASSAQVTSGISGDVFPFITTFRMDPNNPANMWIGGRFMWRSTNAATSPMTWTRTSATQQTGGSITSMAIAPGNSNVVINGAASGQLRRTTAALTADSASLLNATWAQSFTPRGNGNGTISWVEYDPSNANNVWATVSNFNGTPNVNGTSAGHVFRSTNGGASWTLADGTQTPGNVNAIPDIPAHSVVIDPNDGQRVYVGTDLGVFVTLDGGANWYQETSGFSNTVVESMSIHNIGGVSTVYAFTHGRGAYRVSIPSSCSTVGNATPQSFGSAGGSGSIAVTGTAGCDWNAASNSSFITVNSGSPGTANGSVGFTVAPNTTGEPRTGKLTVAGREVSISQDATIITWSNPADIVYGTPLGATQLNATANVPGTFVYTPPAGTVLNVGSSQTLRVVFTPTDTVNYVGASKEVLINVTKAMLTYSATGTSQYSDPLSAFTISFTGFVNGDTPAIVSGSPSCSTTATPNSAPGTYSISCSNGTLTAANYNFTFGTGTYTVTQEDARATYAGQLFVSTGSVSSSSATVNLVATIQDITAVSGDPNTDAYAGDIRNATVTFVNRDNGAVLCTTGPIQLLDPADLKSGTASCDWTTDIGSADSVSYMLGIVVGGYYTRDSSADNSIVTVSKLIPGSIGGGGYIVNTSSGGAKAGDVGAKTQFGFNVRNNKKGSNFQGNVNLILVSGGRTYQIKSTAITSFVAKKGSGGNLSVASFGGKGVIVDITDQAAPVTVDGNANIQMTMTDAGEPGTSDAIALTLWDKRGLLWFSSNWTGTRTIEQILSKGNLQIR